MKTLSSALSTAFGAPVQRPGVLVEAQFALTRRWSSFNTFAWNSQTWTATPMSLEGLVVMPLRITGSLVLDNRDGVIGALVLGEGVQDRVFRLWGFDAGATATGDVVWLADAVGAGATVSETSVTINLRHKAEYVFSPRTFVGPAAGFNQLIPSGTVLSINGIDYKLERR